MRKELQELYDRIVNYSNDIIEGNILACKKHIQACQRFIDDLDKQGKEDFPYFFDLEEVYKFNEWAKVFKHRTGIVKGQQINLTDWQLFNVANLFGWKNTKTGFRRFRKAFISVGRKNAKSELLSIIATYECFVTNDNSEVYITGWNKDGSDIVYREINYQLENPYIKGFFDGKYKNSYGKITHLKSGSFIKPLSREAKNTDNANNPSLAIIDEYKDHLTSEIYDNLETGMVRPNALIVIISTAGPNLNSPMVAEYNYVSKILDPELKDVTNEEYFVMICEMEKNDDIKNKDLWIKANPIVATNEYGRETILAGKLKAALDAPEKMRSYLTKNMNMWVDMREDGYMDMQKWSKCKENFTYEDFRGMECIVGADLSVKLDLTSIAFEFFKDDKFWFIQHSWIPQETYDKRMREGKYRFDLWVEEGNLSICPGATNDYDEIKAYMERIKETYNIKIREFCYDPHNATLFVNQLENDLGYTCVEVRQGALTLNEPTKDLRNKVYEDKIRHNGDGLMTWCMSNCIATQHKQEWIMLDKAKSAEKIDPIAAMVDAHARAMHVLETEQFSFMYVPKKKRG